MDSSETAAAFQDAFNRADWSPLRALFHQQDQDEKDWHGAMAYVRGLRNSGYRIESYLLSVYEQPNWPMFNEGYLYPAPEESVYFSLKDREQRSEQLFLGLSSSKFCYFVEKKAPRTSKRPSAKRLQKDSERISSFIKKTVEDYAASSSKRVSALEILFSLREGFVSVGFQHTSPYEPGHEPFSQHDCLLLPHWTAASPNPEDIQTVGNSLVEIVLKLRTSRQFQVLPKHDNAEVSVEESEGMFGWPEYAEHGKANLM